ncbi:MAG: membrane dipeptidase [Candidatus Latescibacteria bacterium]|nr:membrane dipeptidase [Candidatus Latescibacterota bacterium]
MPGVAESSMEIPPDLENQKKRIAANEKIQEARMAAKKILRPSRAELEHGLELHANSLVIESYGFVPRSAPDGDRVRGAMEAGASADEIEDLREDMSMTRWATVPAERIEFMDAMKAAGVTCVFQNAGQEGFEIDRLIKRLARYTYATDLMRGFIPKAVAPDDIVAAKEQNRHCLYFSGNGVPVPQNWRSVEEELRYIKIFFQLGIRMMHLTYNRRNMIGDGCGEPANGGLSDFGHAAVSEMNRTGVVVDVAHSGWQTSYDAAKASGRPIVASHTVCCSVHEHFRGKPDNVIKAIVDTGGYIGICCIPRYLGGEGNLKTMLDHIDYAAKKFGADHVAIGTDVAYTSRAAAEENKKIPALNRKNIRTPWRSLWPKDDFVTKPEMTQSMAWTNWPLITVSLVQRGYSDYDIRKIIGGNVLRIVRAALA